QICCRYYLMINMVLVVGEDMSSPAVKGMAKLGSAGGHFKFLWIRAETDRVSVGIFGEFGTSRIAGKNDLTPPVAEFFFVFAGTDVAQVGKIDPVIKAIYRVVDVHMRIGQGKTGKNHLSLVRPAVTVRVFQIQHIGCVSDQK